MRDPTGSYCELLFQFFFSISFRTRVISFLRHFIFKFVLSESSSAHESQLLLEQLESNLSEIRFDLAEEEAKFRKWKVPFLFDVCTPFKATHSLSGRKHATPI